MNALSIHDILKATNGKLLCGNSELVIEGICTDTRKIEPHSLFIPLVGERFDGHAFISEALSKGCVAALTARKEPLADATLIYVEDTQKALGALAAFYRKQFAIPIVAITGSVGKTTTKELAATVLESQLPVLKTAGNFNNEIGLPLTLFRLEHTHRAAIVEMGMSGFGEIDRLSQIAAPDIVLMTNIGLSHIENLGSQENIYRAKSEFLKYLPPNGTVILNGDDPILMKHKNEILHRTITVGTSPDLDIWAEDICPKADSVSFTLCYRTERIPCALSFPGVHNITNALLACATGLCLGISIHDVAKALKTYIPADKRMQIIQAEHLTVINDCYNAAPASVEAALKVLAAQPGRKIAVLGDMKELGTISQKAHTNLGKIVAALSIDALFTLGPQATYIAIGAKEAGMNENSIYSFSDICELNQALSTYSEPGDAVLVKASRAMRFEQVTEFLTTRQHFTKE